MAQSEMPSEDDFELIDPNDDFDDDGQDKDWLDLDAGEHVIGEIRDLNPNCGDNDTTVIELARGLGDVVLMWSNNQIDRALDSKDLGVGDVVMIKHTEDTRAFTNDDGEEIEYDVWRVGVVGGGDD